MPAPNDQRFVKIFRFAQNENLWSDGELLDSFEWALTKVIERTPGIAADMAILDALRGWFNHLFPEKPLHRMLSNDRELEYHPGYGNAVVCPNGQSGTFYWDTRTHVTTWAWWDPEKERELLVYDPSEQDQWLSGGRTGVENGGQLSSRNDRLSEGQDHRTPHAGGIFTPDVSRVTNAPSSVAVHSRQDSPRNTTPSDEDEEMAGNRSMASTNVNTGRNEGSVRYASTAHHPRTVGPFESKVIAVNFNEYLAIECFITAKALKAGWTKEQLDEGWRQCTNQSWKHFETHGQAYVQYRAEMNYWNALWPEELFPGRCPLTRKYHMYTGKEMKENTKYEIGYKAPRPSTSASSSADSAARRARPSAEENAH